MPNGHIPFPNTNGTNGTVYYIHTAVVLHLYIHPHYKLSGPVSVSLFPSPHPAPHLASIRTIRNASSGMLHVPRSGSYSAVASMMISTLSTTLSSDMPGTRDPFSPCRLKLSQLSARVAPPFWPSPVSPSVSRGRSPNPSRKSRPTPAPAPDSSSFRLAKT